MANRLNPRFPHGPTIEAGPHRAEPAEVIDLLGPRLTERRRARLDRAIAQRTCEMACVIDGPYDSGNVAAILRTAEGLGIQPIHIIDTQSKAKAARSRITQGADKWLDIDRWQRPGRCMSALKERGYQICATDTHDARPLADIEFDRPTALVVGNEHAGISQQTRRQADVRCTIPMAGLAQSFNMSVAAALTMYHVRRWRIAHTGARGELSQREAQILRAHFFVRAIDHGPAYLAELLDRHDQ